MTNRENLTLLVGTLMPIMLAFEYIDDDFICSLESADVFNSFNQVQDDLKELQRLLQALYEGEN